MARRKPLGAAPDIFHTKTQRWRVGREAAFDSDRAASRGFDGETGIAAHAFLFVSLCETKEHDIEGKGRPWTLNRVQGDEGGQNAGVCQLPDFYVMPHLQSGALVSLVDPLRPQEEPIWAVYPQRRHLLPKVRLLIDKLREELPGALRWSEMV